MAVINPLWAPALRRHWQVLCAVALFVIFATVHELWFQPNARRYALAVKEASAMGMALDPDQMPRLIPPRLFALISQNSRPAREAQEAAGSGSLTAEFIGELSQVMERRSIQVISTEPGPMTQDARSVQVRAHMRARCRYSDFVALLDDLARDQRLIAIERLNAQPEASGNLALELWVSRFILKSGGKT
jgi:hypothetical protein